MKLVWFTAIGFLCLFLSGFFWYQSSLKPASSSADFHTFIISSGDPASLIIQQLASQQLIRSYYPARLYHKLHPVVFRPGIYYLQANQSLSDLFAQISKGPKDIKITFPEGWRREQYATRLLNTFPEFDASEFLQLTATLEGRLFPDTYYLPASPSPQKVVSILTQNFTQKTGSIDKDTLIVASLVERESNNPADSGLIAGIILKRLQNNWPLQLDATVQYAKDTFTCQKTPLVCDYWQPIYDTKFESSFNTYMSPGLPPAPISNPGLSSLNAAKNPVTSDYWYYITGNDGQTYFAADLATQNLHIDTYLKH